MVSSTRRAPRTDRVSPKSSDLTLAINPGSTSTKIAVYRGPKCLIAETIDHPKAELARLDGVAQQMPLRFEAIRVFLAEHGFADATWAVVVGRGGLTKPIEGGVYRINNKMLRDLENATGGEHPSNLGAPLAAQFAAACRAAAMVVDPPIVDELSPLARYAGHPALTRKSLFHALSQRAAARRAAAELGVAYQKQNFIVVHMGGGISIGAHCKGRVVDVNNALDGDGPFSPERSGSLPAGDLARLCFSGECAWPQIRKMITGEGGLFAYLGTNDCREVEDRIVRGDEKADEVYRAMAYQIAKSIGAAAAVLSGKVKAVVLTGGMAKSRRLCSAIRKYAGFVAPFVVYPELEEMAALALSAQAALAGKIEIKEYC
jgi:butyrate kinase